MDADTADSTFMKHTPEVRSIAVGKRHYPKRVNLSYSNRQSSRPPASPAGVETPV
ncbi:hypothetical protein [Microcoleus sp. F4-D5]|uniref:hypothetical protein n=1 Tax=Microcoleus sp. F4-D5 TaxID=2818760 RepID=UPI002FD682C6